MSRQAQRTRGAAGGGGGDLVTDVNSAEVMLAMERVAAGVVPWAVVLARLVAVRAVHVRGAAVELGVEAEGGVGLNLVLHAAGTAAAAVGRAARFAHVHRSGLIAAGSAPAV
eukprot:SAG31_NODE_2795_length_5082_cov_2.673289_2_plen_112_part_00